MKILNKILEWIITLFLWLMGIAVLLMCCAALSGCRSVEYVPVETVRTDTTYISKDKWDSIYVLDSVFVHEKGETLLVEKTRYKYIERVLHDTLYRERRDSVAVPYPVEKRLTWRQHTAIKFFPWLLALCTGMAVYVFRKPILSVMKKLT